VKKYHVHLYPIVHVLVRNVEADSQVEAIKKAEELVDLHKLFAGMTGLWEVPMHYADDIDGFLVDEDGDTEHQNSAWYDAEYKPI
jgi:hypothetical protein